MCTAEALERLTHHELVDTCAQALTLCHQAFVDLYDRDSELTSRSQGQGTPDVVHQFAAAAASSLSHHEIAHLVQFLQSAASRSQASKLQQEDLSNQLSSLLQQFRDEEIKASGDNETRLAQPGGSPDADLGLVLHIQSEDDQIEGFWDKRSATISLLQDKGLSQSFTFGFDWHWRADGSFRGTSGCPATKWKKGLRAMHDHHSVKVLELLPLPFVVTGSSCSRQRLRKHLSSKAQTLKIVVAPPLGVLEIDLDFRDDSLRRIVAHVHHPVAGFFAGSSTRRAMAAQLDAGLDFML